MSVTLADAAENIGRGVVYCPRNGPREDGTIVRVTDFHIFVQYVGDRTPKATSPEDLEWLS